MVILKIRIPNIEIRKAFNTDSNFGFKSNLMRIESQESDDRLSDFGFRNSDFRING